ncbi:ISAs1 family transposase [Gemmata sp. G18]|uniref:ISAs1 family transposase n=1 Tax=Gemmata palustris TaxID=2822762 RepID=A0ABS5C4W0_9BACT|nr:ISAs1 family transposase [Gemmata palustris]MBP3960470.1 ISAs1 family transposase [Gemmata palustris]
MAVICGADSFEEIERFGDAREDWLKTFLTLPNGIPSHDTFNRVLSVLDRDQFSACFARWMTDLCEDAGLRPIAIDGKACRAAPGDTFSGCLHLVNAWAVENNLFLGQVAVADGSNEIAALPALLKVLDLKGALVTIDAAFCQKAIIGQIREQGDDYLVTVKGNQQALHRAVVAAFELAGDAEFAGCEMVSSVEDGHGRHEERYVTVIRDPEGLPKEWGGRGRGGDGRSGARGERQEHPLGALLHHQFAQPGAGVGRLHPGPLGRLERVALVPRRRVPRGREPDAGHERRGQPGRNPAGRRLAPQAGQGQHQGQEAQCLLGSGLPQTGSTGIQSRLDALTLVFGLCRSTCSGRSHSLGSIDSAESSNKIRLCAIFVHYSRPASLIRSRSRP